MKSLETRFGQVLRELREKRKLSQADLATDAELDRTYISLLERGLRQPTLTTIFTLARALDISPSSMIKQLED